MTLPELVSKIGQGYIGQALPFIAAAPYMILALHARVNADDLLFLGNTSAATGLCYLVHSILTGKQNHSPLTAISVGCTMSGIAHARMDQTGIALAYLLPATHAAILAAARALDN